MKKYLAVLILVLGVYHMTEAKENQKVFLGPNVQSRDMLKLFSHPEEWEKARSQIDILQFYFVHLANRCDPKWCGNNVLNNFVEVVPGGAFKWLKDRDIEIGVEIGAVKEYSCGEIEININDALVAIENVEYYGGEVSYIAMDEPFRAGVKQVNGKGSPVHCGFTIEQTAEDVAYYIQQINLRHPKVKIGLVSPYPFLTKNEIMQAIESLERLGIKLPFFHLDFSYRHALDIEIDFLSEIAELQDFCKRRGIKFGIIVIGGHVYNDKQYFAETMINAIALKSIVDRCDHVIFQSWIRIPGSNPYIKTIPNNLPESRLYSHTWLLNTILDYFRK